MTRGRLAITAGLACACALVFAVILRGGSSPNGGREEEVSPPDPSGHRAELRSPVGELAAQSEAVQPHPASAASIEPGSTTEDHPAFPSIRVEVRGAGGTLVPGATLYALPAGAPGADGDRSGLPTADAPDGIGTLRLPGAGHYDVGVLADPFRHALVEDVEVPRDRALVVTLDPLAEVRFTLAPAVAAQLRGSPQEGMQIRATEGPRQASYPGRTQGLASDSLAWSHREGDPLGLPRGVLFRASFAAGDFRTRVLPAEFTPPADLQVVVGFAVEHRIEFQPSATTFPYDVEIPVDFDWDGLRRHVPFRLSKGSPLAALGGQWTQETDRASGRVAWSGPFVASGATAFQAYSEVKPLDVLTIPIQVRNPPPAPDQSDERPSIRIANANRLTEGLQVQLGCDGSEWAEADSASPSRHIPLEYAGAWAHAFAEPNWIAGPVPTHGRDTDLTLVRGGFLVAVPERLPPEGLVALIERVDGAPLFVGGSSCSSPPHLAPGIILGPFEPGVVRFRVRVGTTTLVEIEGTVVADLHRALQIPALSPPRR